MKALEAKGIFCFKVHGGPTMMAGLPDIVACVNGHFVGLETKMPGKEHTLSPIQSVVHYKIEQAHGTAQMVTSVEEALRICQPLLDS